MTEQKKIQQFSSIFFALLSLGIGFIFFDLIQNEDGGTLRGGIVLLFSELYDTGGLLLFWLPFALLSLLFILVGFRTKL
jgi:hypothetical protein